MEKRKTRGFKLKSRQQMHGKQNISNMDFTNVLPPHPSCLTV